MILPAGRAEAPALAALHAGAFPPPEAWGEEAMALMLGMPGAFGLWRPEAGLVLAQVVAGESEILTLAVMPAARGQGLGQALMRAAMAEAARRGAAAMFLEVASGNAAARALYAGLGFTQVGCRRRYYANGEDALVLKSQLPIR